MDKVRVMESRIYQYKLSPKTLPLSRYDKAEVEDTEEHQLRIREFKRILGEWYGGSMYIDWKPMWSS